jgi:hypothetical protein
MDKTIRKYTSLEAMKTDELREWQRLPGYERLNAAFELSVAAYQIKGPEGYARPQFQRTLVHLRRPEG